MRTVSRAAFWALLTLTSQLFSPHAIALELKTLWSDDFRKWIHVRCDWNEPARCAKLCADPRECIVLERSCRNCAGSASLFIKDLLDTLGDVYVNLDEPVGVDTVLKTVSEGAFITLGPDTIFHFGGEFNSEDLRARFQRICNDPTENPLLFLSVQPRTRELGEILFVTCQDQNKNLCAFKVGKNRDLTVSPR